MSVLTAVSVDIKTFFHICIPLYLVYFIDLRYNCFRNELTHYLYKCPSLVSPSTLDVNGGYLFIMKQFDWTHLRKETNPQKWQWLFDVHNTQLTEADFIIAMKKLKKYSASKNRMKKYCPSRLKKEYSRLKSKFGFFNPKQND